MILFGTTLLAGVSTAAFPFAEIFGRETSLFECVSLAGFSLAAAVTSFQYADTHHALVWCCALVPNLLFFLIPAAGIWGAARNRWQAWCSVAIIGWCVFYLASLFWLFPGTIDL
jgi:hypothetical protein